MVIYEVNLTIARAIEQEFLAWLPEHIERILAASGFKTANVFTEVGDAAAAKVTIQYAAESLAQINQYIAEHSPKMRQEAIDKFADQFSIVRRILELVDEF